MLKLVKHLRPFIWSIVLIFLLLFAQAMADLSLPAYMADIVNVGIQQGGIDSAVPQAIRESEMAKLSLFMSHEEKEIVGRSFSRLEATLVPPGEYEKYIATYPGLAAGPIYVLTATDKEIITSLEVAFGRSIMAVFGLTLRGVAGFADNITVPEAVDPFLMMAALPPDQLDLIRQKVDEQVRQLPPSLTRQSATAYILAEYQALGMNTRAIQLRYMMKVGALMLLLTLGGAAASVWVGYLAARVAGGLARNLRLQLFTQVEGFSSAEFDRFSTASLITRTTNDIQQIQMLLVILFRIVFYAPILGLGGILRVISGDVSMLWIIAAAVVAILMMIGLLFIIAVPKFRIIQSLIDRVNLVTREMLSGLMVIRAFNNQKHEEQRFDAANTDLTRTALFINRVIVMLMPTMMLVMNTVWILIVWVGSHRVDAGALQVGDMMAFMQYTMQIIMAFLMISMVFIMLPRAIVSGQRINEVLETEPVVRDPERPEEFVPEKRGYVEFKNVFFRYPGAKDDALKDISFTARPGETTAIIGSTGSGKSTLVNLIPRFYDVTGGSILVDGVDVRRVNQRDLRERIGYVPQRSWLFSGTIASNISYAREGIESGELEQVLATAQVLDFARASGDGFSAPVAQGGANFSGGQKQRLSIARALAKRPEIYIFDDSFSALDFRTDAAVRKALKKFTRDATVLIVTQRVGTVMGAEQIIVLEDGRIVGIGRHRDLMESCPVYREIAESQLSREELGS